MFRTPPRSNRKPGRLTYYEDLYGKQNADEAFDRFPDECEETSDSDEEDDEQPAMASRKTAAGFFKPYARKPVVRHSEERDEESSSSSDVDADAEGDVGRDRGIFSNIDPLRESIRPSTALPTTKPKNKRSAHTTTPKKFGMFSAFGAAPPTPDADRDKVNMQAEDMMGFATLDNGNNNGGGQAFTSASLGNLDDGFQTLEQEGSIPANPYAFGSSIDPSVLNARASCPVAPTAQMGGMQHEVPYQMLQDPYEKFMAKYGASPTATDPPNEQREDQAASVDWPSEQQANEQAAMVPMPATEKGEDEGYQADRDEMREDGAQETATPKRRGRPSKSQTPQKQAKTVESESLGRTRAATNKHVEEVKMESLANRLRKRSKAPVVAVKPTKRSKTTARAATLKEKAKQVVAGRVAKERLTRNAVKVAKDGKGFVILGQDEVDYDEYEKHY